MPTSASDTSALPSLGVIHSPSCSSTASDRLFAAHTLLGSPRKVGIGFGCLSSSLDNRRSCFPVVVASASNAVRKKQAYESSASSSVWFYAALITKEKGLVLYEDMVLGRAFEDMCAQMYYRGKMFSFVRLYNGQEAVSTGFIKLLKQEDSMVSTYRDHVHVLSKGVPARAVTSELFGKTAGCCRGHGGSVHLFSKEHNFIGGFAFIGEGIQIATGAAFTSKY